MCKEKNTMRHDATWCNQVAPSSAAVEEELQGFRDAAEALHIIAISCDYT